MTNAEQKFEEMSPMKKALLVACLKSKEAVIEQIAIRLERIPQ